MKLGRSHLAVSTRPHVISFQLLNLLASNHGKNAYPKWKAHSWRALPLPSANHYFFSIKIMKYKWLQERGKIPELFPAGIVSSDWNGAEKTWVQRVSTCPFNGVQQKQRKKNKSKYFLHLAADTVCVCTTTHHVPITLTTHSSAHLSQKGFRSKAVVPKSMYITKYTGASMGRNETPATSSCLIPGEAGGAQQGPMKLCLHRVTLQMRRTARDQLRGHLIHTHWNQTAV